MIAFYAPFRVEATNLGDYSPGSSLIEG